MEANMNLVSLEGPWADIGFDYLAKPLVSEVSNCDAARLRHRSNVNRMEGRADLSSNLFSRAPIQVLACTVLERHGTLPETIFPTRDASLSVSASGRH